MSDEAGLDAMTYPRIYRHSPFYRFWLPLLFLVVAATDAAHPSPLTDLASQGHALTFMGLSATLAFMAWRPVITLHRHTLTQRWLFQTRRVADIDIRAIRAFPTIKDTSFVLYSKSGSSEPMMVSDQHYRVDAVLMAWLRQFPEQEIS